MKRYELRANAEPQAEYPQLIAYDSDGRISHICGTDESTTLVLQNIQQGTSEALADFIENDVAMTVLADALCSLVLGESFRVRSAVLSALHAFEQSGVLR